MMSPPGPDPLRMAKRRCRRAVRTAVAALDPDDRRRQEAALVDTFSTLPGWSGARTVLLYVSAFADEVETAPMLAIAYESGRRVALPRVADGRLRLHLIDDPRRDLAAGVLGIPEPIAGTPELSPEAIDWALVPGIAFDVRGYRLGRGAGHYDRLLPTLRPDCPCWAVCLRCQLLDALPVEDHDVPLDGLATPDRIVVGAGRLR